MLSARMALARSLRDGIDISPVFFRKRLQAAKTAQKEGAYFRRLLCAGANPYVVVFRWRRHKITKATDFTEAANLYQKILIWLLIDQPNAPTLANHDLTQCTCERIVLRGHPGPDLQGKRRSAAPGNPAGAAPGYLWRA